MLGRFELSSRKGRQPALRDMDHYSGEVLIPDPLARFVQRWLRSAALDVTIQDDNCRDAFYVEHGARSHRAVRISGVCGFPVRKGVSEGLCRRDGEGAPARPRNRVPQATYRRMQQSLGYGIRGRGGCTTTEGASSIVSTRRLSERLSGGGRSDAAGKSAAFILNWRMRPSR